ncbi:MAG: energy transducer TonB [Burkholderiaceae bacterium]
MASVQSVRDPIQRTTGGAARATATRRPAAAAQVTVDLDALFGAAPPAEPAARRVERAPALPARAPARSRSHIAIAGLLIGVAALIALYVQLYSVNTERQNASSRPASMSPSPQAILPASPASAIEPAVAPAPAPTKATIEENPVLRSLLAADRPTPRQPKPATEAIAPVAVSRSPRTEVAPEVPHQGATDLNSPPPAAPVATPAAAAVASPAAAPPGLVTDRTATPAPSPPVAMSEPASAAARPVVLVPVSRPQPAFPQQALRDRVAGRVVARVTVGTDGTVSAVEIESSTPPRVFDRAAVAALRQWRYAPIDRPQQTTIELDFKLE